MHLAKSGRYLGMPGAEHKRVERRYRVGLLAMRGGVVVALLAVLALPPGEVGLGLFGLACLAVGWGVWQRRRYCPVRRARRRQPGA